MTPVNDPPTIGNLAATLNEDSTHAGNLLTNVSDPDGDPLEVVLITPPVAGNLTLNPTGDYTFTPPLNYAGAISFVVGISDGTVTVQSTVDLTVTSVNDPPVVVNQAYSASEDTPLLVYAQTGLLAGATDPSVPLAITLAA